MNDPVMATASEFAKQKEQLERRRKWLGGWCVALLIVTLALMVYSLELHREGSPELAALMQLAALFTAFGCGSFSSGFFRRER